MKESLPEKIERMVRKITDPAPPTIVGNNFEGCFASYPPTVAQEKMNMAAGSMIIQLKKDT